MTAKPLEVAIIYRFLPQWRVEFFCGLRKALASKNITLRLYYGKNPPQPLHKFERHRLKWGNEVDLAWATPVPNRLWNVGKYEMVWQHLPKEILSADLIIMMQENSILSNYKLALGGLLRRRKLALWGHGLNHQENDRSWGNIIKRLYSTRVDWWFAYTPGVADRLVRLGFSAKRVTIVNNAIDSAALRAEAQRVSPSQLDSVRKELGLGKGPVGIFCGAMYPDKRIEFLTQACDRVRETIPDFEVLFLGTGDDVHLVQSFAESRPWVHYVGPKYGMSRVPYFMVSDAFLMPGLVGLAVIDCFALGTPLVTTKYPYHSPEIEYIEAGVDAVVSEDSLDGYVSAVIDVLQSEELRNRLKLGCRRKELTYTIQNMVENFSRGVQQALAAP